MKGADEDPVRQRNIDIADGLYRRFKAECSLRGVTMRDGFAEALRDWIVRPKKHEGEKGEGHGSV